MLIYPFKEVEKWSVSQKSIYYDNLRKYCGNRKKSQIGCSNIINILAPHLRNFPIEIKGEENIPKETTVLFIGNHSNSHDFFVIKEALNSVNRPVTPLAAWDGLNFLSRFLFRLGDITFIDRRDKDSIEKGTLNFCGKILNGKCGFILGEATWNLHPTLPMQKVKAGVVLISLITGKPVVPVIMEYVEVPNICRKEKDLYSKCVVYFGAPFYSSAEEDIFKQSEAIQHAMESMRRELWRELNIQKDSIEQIDRDIYLNHLYLKKYKAFGFKYNSEQESKFLLEKENEYIVDEQGNFVPGILEE